MTRPPATGSIGLLAVTVTTSGAGNAPEAVWPLPEVRAMVNPLDSKAPMSTVPLTMRWQPALVGGDAGGDEGVVARAEGRAAGQQGHGLGRAAVVAQRCQQRRRAARRWCRSGRSRPSRCCRLVLPIRLLPWEVKPPSTSGLVPPVFPATIVLARVVVPVRLVVHAAAVRSCR